MKAAHTGSTVQDRKPCDASQTPAGGTDSTAACTEPCSKKNRGADRQKDGFRRIRTRHKNTRADNSSTTQEGRSEVPCIQTHSQAQSYRETLYTYCRYMHLYTHILCQSSIQANQQLQIHAHGNKDTGSSLRSTGVSSKKV